MKTNKYILLLLICCNVLVGTSQNLKVYDGTAYLEDETVVKNHGVVSGPMNIKEATGNKNMTVLFKIDFPMQVKNIVIQIGDGKGSTSFITETYSMKDKGGTPHIQMGNQESKVWGHTVRLDYKVSKNQVPTVKWVTVIVESVSGKLTTQYYQIH